MIICFETRTLTTVLQLVVHQTYQPKMGPPTKTPIWKGLSAHTIE